MLTDPAFASQSRPGIEAITGGQITLKDIEERRGRVVSFKEDYIDAVSSLASWVAEMKAAAREWVLAHKNAEAEYKPWLDKQLAQAYEKAKRAAQANPQSNWKDEHVSDGMAAHEAYEKLRVERADAKVPRLKEVYLDLSVQKKADSLWEHAARFFYLDDDFACEIITDVVSQYEALRKTVDFSGEPFDERKFYEERAKLLFDRIDPSKLVHKKVLEGQLFVGQLKSVGHLFDGPLLEAMAPEVQAALVAVPTSRACPKCLEPVSLLASVCKTCRSSLDDSEKAVAELKDRIGRELEKVREQYVALWNALPSSAQSGSLPAENWEAWFGNIRTEALRRAEIVRAEMAAKQKAESDARDAALESELVARNLVVLDLKIENKCAFTIFAIDVPNGSCQISEAKALGPTIDPDGMRLNIAKGSKDSIRLAMPRGNASVSLVAHGTANQAAQPIELNCRASRGKAVVTFEDPDIRINVNGEVESFSRVSGGCSALAAHLGNPNLTVVIRPAIVLLSLVYGLGIVVYWILSSTLVKSARKPIELEIEPERSSRAPGVIVGV